MEGCWVFGGCERLKVDPGTKRNKYKNKAGRMFSVIVKDRKETTLLPLIRKHINPGSIIISDMWKAYEKIEDLHGCLFRHMTVNHSKEFKNKDTGACTNTIEGAWRSRLKSKIDTRNYNRFCLGEYLSRRQWILENEGRLWDALWETLSTTKYEKICYLRRKGGGSWKSKHKEEEEIRKKEEQKRLAENEKRKARRELKKREKEEKEERAGKKFKLDPYWLEGYASAKGQK